MRRNLLLLLGASTLFLPGVSHAAPGEYVFEGKRVCDADKDFCISGTMTYYPNPRLLHLRARVQKAPGPGMLRIRLTGTNELGHRHFAPFEVRVRGHYGEIINHKMIPDYPDVQGWEIEYVEFVVDEVGQVNAGGGGSRDQTAPD